ncbi:MAG TPA: polyphosphate kinase 1, partial [bacterium]|nr:polyphosphate kinase 1 [bacterium]
NDLVIPGARYHNFKDFIAFPKVPGRGLHYPSLRVARHAELPAQVSVLAIMERGDRLMHYPYQSFDAMIRFLREAAIDPEVTAIKTTLYRAAKESRVVNALINAVKNGKAVTVLVELQARFNEEDNLHLADRLAEEGARVIYSQAGLKIHCKLTLVERQRGGKVLRYCNLATGNYNEQTAQAYCDDSLFTSDPRLTADVARLFRHLEGGLKDPHYAQLLVAPQFLRKQLTHLIEREIRNAKRGRPAFITLKMNNLSDPGMIALLYKASQAGVPVRLIVRGICCLVPGVRHLSAHVKAISIVDRFLEHSRVFVFGNGGHPQVFLSSADLMTRNLDFRVEAVWPIHDSALKQELLDLLDIQWRDNVKARVINRSQNNRYRKRERGHPVRAQQAIRGYLESKSTPPAKAKP